MKGLLQLVSQLVNLLRKPDAGNLHVRFDEGDHR